MKTLSHKSGFSLMEMTVVLTVLAIISTMAIGLYQERDYSNKVAETKKRMAVVEQTIMNYRNVNNRLPCPANATVANGGVNFGYEGQTPGSCMDGTPTANVVTGEVVKGVLPTRTLQLPDDYMNDAWGRRFTYVVDRRMTNNQSTFKYPVNDCDVGSIRMVVPACTVNGTYTAVSCAPGIERSTRGIYALISHGENGHGAYLASGQRRNAQSSNQWERVNAGINDTFADAFLNAFMMKRINKTAGSTFDSFDDIVVFKERWGMVNAVDLLTKPAPKFSDLAVLGDGVCGLGTDGRIYCWGSNSDGKLGNNSAVGANSLTPQQITMPTGVHHFIKIIPNQSHVCALANNGQLYCWGKNENGEFASGVVGTSYYTPQLASFPAGMTGYIDIASSYISTTGNGRTCALTNDSAMYCWGDRTSGGMGDGSGSGGDITSPVKMTFPTGVTKFEKPMVSLTGETACAMAAEGSNTGTLYCWGYNMLGETGTGAAASSAVSVPTEASVAAGSNRYNINPNTYTLAMNTMNNNCYLGETGIPQCTGKGTTGGIGNSASTNRNSTISVTLPASVTAFSSLVRVATTNVHCALGDNGRPYCWGSGPIGDGTNTTQNRPTAVTLPVGVTSFDRLYGIYTGVCGTASDAKTYCWGTNASGELGIGNTSSPINSPTAMTLPSGVKRFSVIRSGSAATCGIADTGDAYCWGSNTSGQLGDGTTTARTVPTKVVFPPLCYKGNF